MTGGPPVTGWKILPPKGMPITGVPPVTGMMIRGDKLSCRGGGKTSGVVTAAGAALGKELSFGACGCTAPCVTQPAIASNDRLSMAHAFIGFPVRIESKGAAQDRK